MSTERRRGGLRTATMWRVALHLYYTFSDDEVIVRALWGAIENAVLNWVTDTLYTARLPPTCSGHRR